MVKSAWGIQPSLARHPLFSSQQSRGCDTVTVIPLIQERPLFPRSAVAGCAAGRNPICSGELDAGPGTLHRRRLYFLKLVFQPLLRVPQIIALLHSQPKPWSVASKLADPECHLS